jgi:hypothetical protein
MRSYNDFILHYTVLWQQCIEHNKGVDMLRLWIAHLKKGGDFPENLKISKDDFIEIGEQQIDVYFQKKAEGIEKLYHIYNNSQHEKN